MKVHVYAYSDLRYDPRILKQCRLLIELGYDVSFFGVKFAGSAPCSEVSSCDFFRRAHTLKTQVLQYFLFVLHMSYVSFQLPKKPCLVIVHNMPNFLSLGTWFYRVLQVPVVMDLHDDSLLVLGSRVKNSLTLRLISFIEMNVALRFADHIITVNSAMKDRICRFVCSEKVSTIHNAPDFYHQTARQITKPLREDVIRLVYVGNLGEQFGVIEFIEMFDRLGDMVNCRLELDIWGGGRLEGLLADEIIRLGLADRVLLRGRYTPEELPSILDAYDFGIAVYNKNPLSDILLPVKVLEYVSCGIPVISSRINTLLDYFPEDCLFYYRDISDIVVALSSSREDVDEKVERSRDILDSISWEREKLVFKSLVEKVIH